MPHKPVKRPRLLEAQRRKYESVPHSANGGATWPFSTPEATWEVQARVQCLPLSDPFNLTFSFLLHHCELRNTGNAFTVTAGAVRCAYALASVPGLPRSVRVLIMRRRQTFELRSSGSRPPPFRARFNYANGTGAGEAWNRGKK